MPSPFNIQTSPIAPGITLVEAGDGTGKTYALTRMVLRLLLEGTPECLECPVKLPNQWGSHR
jgi:exodeoxyribonuclease V beta subunit